MVEERDIDPISLLASEYKEDLDNVKLFRRISIITDRDIKRLISFAIKYNIDDSINKNNFYVVIGNIERTILEKLEKFAIGDILERVREESSSKTPKKRKIDRQPIPESLL